MRSPRIACLVPAATDLAADLGLDVVGVSHECDHPIARGLPVLTRSRIAAMHPHGPGPAEIDQQVSAAVAAGEPLYVVDRAALARLAPDIVLSQAICDVCAARADRCDLPPDTRLIELAATSLSGLADDVRAVAAAAGVPERGEACLADIAAHHAALVRPRDRPRTLALEWGHPPFLGGHWVPEMVALAGGEHLLSRTGQPSRRADWAEIAAADPDLVVFIPCGYDLAAAAAEAEALCRHSPLGQLRCVRDGRLWAVDAVRLFSRCTPQSVTRGAAVLAALLRGDAPPIGQACRIESTPALS